MKRFLYPALFFILGILALAACGGLEDSATETEDFLGSFEDTGLPDFYSKFNDNVTITLDGDEVVLETDDIPNHPSPYFGEGNENYEEPPPGMVVNPNRIAEQDYVFRIPLDPTLSDDPGETNLDAIGVAVNGVVFFNQYAGRTLSGDWLPLDNEIVTFDPCNGHPAQRDNYHYHMEPLFLTETDPSALVGVMLDGFPIYGPMDSGESEPADLDECNGHTGPTADFPEGIYHYHTTEEEPYLIGCYRGEAGTVSN